MKLLLFAVSAIAILIALVLWAAGGLQGPRRFTGPIQTITTDSEAIATATLTVVVWNIAWGRGWGSEGRGDAKPASFFEASLSSMGDTLAKHQPDLVLLQEVDFDCTRSHGVDQARVLAERAGLGYIAPAVSWDANWVPFPYWPPSEHFGRMSSGGAILSRFPLAEHQVEWFEKPSANAWWYNLFYPFRYDHSVQVLIGDDAVLVHNTHLEAFNQANRELQAEHLSQALSATETELLLFGGDLNAVPPEQSVRHGYPDEPATDHRTDRTVSRFRDISQLKDAYPPDFFVAHQADLLTFPAHGPSRKLDHFFFGSGFELIEASVLAEAGPVSDHLPLLIKLRRK